MTLAATLATPIKVANPRQKKIKRVLTRMFACAVLSGCLLIIMLASRPPWHTVTGTGKPGEWVARVECPEDWQLEANPNSGRYAEDTTLTVRRKPLTGMWAWWNKFVLHRADNSAPTEFHVWVMPQTRYNVLNYSPAPPDDHDDVIRNANAVLDAIQSIAQSIRAQSTTFQRCSYPLGPALFVSQQQAEWTVRGSNIVNVTNRYDSLYIAPTEAKDFMGHVTVTWLAPPGEEAALKPILERMTRSIRLVKQ